MSVPHELGRMIYLDENHPNHFHLTEIIKNLIELLPLNIDNEVIDGFIYEANENGEVFSKGKAKDCLEDYFNK
ncbi:MULTISPECIES: hypothetical protein [Paenibacillus]|uniref:hypothetical protein n=1 Tax=Paenibacillus TaxID=44249 RepID=UPI000B808590|nr:hypothetical protein [Paenibacillus amylolyticus]